MLRKRPRRVRESRLCGGGVNALLQSVECAPSGVCRTLLGLGACSEGKAASGRDVTPDVALDLHRRAPSGAVEVQGVGGDSQTQPRSMRNTRTCVLPLRGCRAARCWKETSRLSSSQCPSCLMQRRGPQARLPDSSGELPTAPLRRCNVRSADCQASSYAVAHAPSGAVPLLQSGTGRVVHGPRPEHLT